MKNSDYKVRKLIIIAIGIVQVLVGVVAAYYGPLEIYCFYFFSEGGQFYYEGFGFGSFWFALLVVQNIGYYVISGVLLPVGVGNVKRRRWALTLSRLYIQIWLAAGVWVMINFIALVPFILNLNLSPGIIIMRLTIVVVFWFLGFCLLPSALHYFYKDKKVQSVFEESDPQYYWIEKYPFPTLVLLFLYTFYIIILHLALFFQGIFPFFGTIILGRPAAYIISLCILLLLGLMYGVFNLRLWAWWGSLGYFLFLTVSAGMTFTRYDIIGIIKGLNLPEFEVEFLEKAVIWQGINLFTLLVIPLLATLGWVVYSRSYFCPESS